MSSSLYDFLYFLQNKQGVRIISEVVSCSTVLNWPQVLGRTGKFRPMAELS